MTKTKLKVGMKVVPVSKSAGGKWFPCSELKAAKERGQDFLYISRFDRDGGKEVVVLVADEGDDYGNFYLESDLKPYRKFQLGDRVTPIAKTVKGYGDLEGSANWSEAKNAGRNYLTIVDFDEEENAYICNGRENPSINSFGDFFHEADLVPYVEYTSTKAKPAFTNKFKVGDKVVPIAKTVKDYEGLENCKHWKAIKKNTEQPYLIVVGTETPKSQYSKTYVLNKSDKVGPHGSFYNEEDLVAYVEKPVRKFQRGDKVVPHTKTVYTHLEDSYAWKNAQKLGNNFLYVTGYEGDYVKCAETPTVGADFFNESDLTLYVEQPTTPFVNGDKVVPHSKSVFVSLLESTVWRQAQEKGQNFLYVRSYDSSDKRYCLNHDEFSYGGDYFLEKDLVAYVEQDIEVTTKIAEEKTMKTTTKKLIKSNAGSFYGYIGTKSDYAVNGRELQVGDIIAYKSRSGNIRTTTIVGEIGYSADRINGRTLKHVGLMGWLATPINKLVNEGDIRDIKVVVKAEHLTPEILKYTDSYFNIVEEEVKHMTIEEIQKELGYEIVLEK